MTRIQQGIINC